MKDTLSILYHFEDHVGTQREQVLELQGFGCNLEAVLASQNQCILRSPKEMLLSFKKASLKVAQTHAQTHRLNVAMQFCEYKTKFLGSP